MMASRRERSSDLRAGVVSRLGVLSAVAVAVYAFESLLPMPIPWARLGLSNVMVVVALFSFGLRQALVVNLVRIVAGNLVLGLLFSPAFVFSVAGSMSALAIMAVMRWKLVPPFSVVGASCLGAVASNAVQVLVFAAAFTRSEAWRGLLGVFLLVGVGVGLLTGLVASVIIEKVGLAGPRQVH